VESVNPKDDLGDSVRDAGGDDGDGIADMIISAAGVDVGADADQGEAYVIFGSASLASASFDLTPLDGPMVLL